MDDFSGLIKYIVDHFSDKYKLILSGSSSIQIKHKFKDSLVGRKVIFELFPLSFSEFCRFHGEDIIADILENNNFFDIKNDPVKFEKEKVFRILKEYLIFGGFPGVALQKSSSKKRMILKDIVQSYILKDIRNLFNLEKSENFNHLVRLLAIFTGKDLNYSQISNEIKLNNQTMQNYLQYLLQEPYPTHQ